MADPLFEQRADLFQRGFAWKKGKLPGEGEEMGLLPFFGRKRNPRIGGMRGTVAFPLVEMGSGGGAGGAFFLQREESFVQEQFQAETGCEEFGLGETREFF